MKKFLLILTALAGAAGVFAAEIRYPEYAVESAKDGIIIKDGKGQTVVRIGRQLFSWSPPVAIPDKIEKSSDKTFKISYRTEKDSTGEVSLSGTLTANPDGLIRLDWELSAPGPVKTGGIMQELILPPGVVKESPYKSGLWQRNERGGVPVEVRDGYFRAIRNGDIQLFTRVAGNVNYTSRTSDHINYRKEESGKYTASLELQACSPGLRGFEAAALYHKRPLALELSTAKPFTIFESGAPEFKAEITSFGAQRVKVEVTARDYDGKTVLNETRDIALKPFECNTLAFRLPEAERAIYFVEVKAGDIFARTNLAILPPHRYEHRGESAFALSAYFMIPDESSVYKLMERMGVRILRHGDNRATEKYGILSLDHVNVNPKSSPAEAKKKIGEILDRAAKFQNPEIEFCNEWNMNKKGEEKRLLATRYAEVLKEFAAERDKRGIDLKIIGMGMAGPDTEFLKLTAEAGALPLFTGGVALHPGRGNFTADYTENFWSYLGAVRRYKKVMKELGITTLHLSEVYAGTHPNAYWKDSYRHAAENTVLTYALGVAEGAASIQFYQLHDGVWHDQGGVKPEDSEYHYGLLMRDGVIKPSLLAYCAVAEALDGAKFVKYLDFGNKVYGVAFETPRGPLAFLYDRTDGCILSKKGDVHPEPWVEQWKTRNTHSFDTVGATVTAIDPIGRAVKIAAPGNKVKLTLSGAPLMVYGIKF